MLGSERLRGRIEGYRARRVQSRLAGPQLLRAFAAAFPAATFVEIGANDGEQLDHLRELILQTEWRGVMVEPVPYVFERLRRNYARVDRVALENVAIAEGEGSRALYHLRRVSDPEAEGLPPWYDAIGSFSREHVLAHRAAIPNIERYLVETQVTCATFDSVCAKHGLTSVDLLLIDTEGYDFEILRNIDLSRDRPVLVTYEHRHLDAEERAAGRRLLRECGFETMEEGHETWCLRTDAEAGLTRMWRKLRPAVPGVAAYEEPWWGADDSPGPSRTAMPRH